MKITEHADGTKTLEGTSEELAVYYGQPRRFTYPTPCPSPSTRPNSTGDDWEFIHRVPFSWETPFRWGGPYEYPTAAGRPPLSGFYFTTSAAS